LNRRHAILALDVFALMVVGITAVLVFPLFQDARFEVVNGAMRSVRVFATWEQQQRDLGILSPGDARGFDVGGESTLRFIVRFPDGATLSSEEIYFSSGMTVIVTVTDTGIVASYGPGGP